MQLEELIETHDKAYRELKARADEENIVLHRHWFGHFPHRKDVDEEIREYREDPDGFSESKLALPPRAYYREKVLPQIQAVAHSLEELEQLSNICLKWIEKIAFTKVPNARGKSPMVHFFMNQFVKYLYQEDERVVLGIAGLQANRVNLHNELRDYPVDNETIKEFLTLFKESEFKKYLPDVAEIMGNIHSGFQSEVFLKKAFPILGLFKQKGAEDLIPAYLRLSKAAGFPEELGFHFTSLDIVDVLLAFDGLGNFRDLAVSWYEKQLAHRERRSIGEGVLELTKKLLESRHAPVAETYLKICVGLTEKGAETFSYIDRVLSDDPVLFANHQHILDYAFELAEADGACATAYLRSGGREFDLDPSQRQRYHDVGLRLARNFKEGAKKYFGDWSKEPPIRILREFPREFEAWVEKIDQVGRKLPKELDGWIVHSVDAIKYGVLDRSLGLVLDFDERLNRWRETCKERVLSIDGPISAYFNSFDCLMRTSIKLERYLDDLFYFHTIEELDYFTMVPDAVCRLGIDYDKYVQLLPDLISLGLERRFEKDFSLFRPIIDAEIGYSRKVEILLEYSLAAQSLGEDCPPLDLDGNWRATARTVLLEKWKDKNGGFPIEGLAFEDLIRLGSIYGSVADTEKLRFVLGERVAKKSISKAFPLGKLYGSRIVGGAKKKEDPVELTRYLVYGIISREPEKVQEAKDYFEVEKLEEVRKFIAPKVIFNQIKGFLPGLHEGSADAAKEILDILRTNYCNKESMCDMIATVESLFLADIKFDSLELRMQKGDFSDLFDNRRNLCCAFFPTGIEKQASMNYLLDEYVGLLHLVPKVGDVSLDPIGVAILVQARDASAKRYLVVEGVEAGMGVDRVSDTLWIPFFHEGILSVASDVDAQNVIYALNSEGNAKPRKVIEYLNRRFHPAKESVELMKLRKKKPILDQFVLTELEKLEKSVQAYKEAEENHAAWNVSDKRREDVGSAYRAIEKRNGLYLEAFTGKRRDPFRRPMTCGTVTGLVFSVGM